MNMGVTWAVNMFNVGGFGFHHRSDRRLKRYIRRVGESKRGFVLYSFQYIWGGPFYVGVMAQDLLTTYPEAVSVGPDNYFMVDYSKLDFDMMATGGDDLHRAAALKPARLWDPCRTPKCSLITRVGTAYKNDRTRRLRRRRPSRPASRRAAGRWRH